MANSYVLFKARSFPLVLGFLFYGWSLTIGQEGKYFIKAETTKIGEIVTKE